jgi:hypothetical protein
VCGKIGYNETVAPQYFPLTKKEALEQGFNWSDYERPLPQVKKTIAAKLLPDDVKDVGDDILDCAIECETSGKPFRIIRAELDFYRKNNLSLPRKNPDQRHFDRMALRPSRKLRQRTCMCTEATHDHTGKCDVEFETTFSPEGREIVYCEKCYLKAVN